VTKGAVMIKISDNYIKIDSKNNTLLLGLRKLDNHSGIELSWAEILYYGKKIRDAEDFSYLNENIEYFASSDDCIFTRRTISSNGDCNNKESLLTVEKNGVFSNRFQYDSAKMVDGFTSPFPTARKKSQTVCLTYIDAISKVTLNQYYTVFDDSDVIATHTEVVNTTDTDVYVN
jgi:alpha-galactosidase